MNPISTPLQGESIEDIVSPSWYRNFAEGLQGEIVYEIVAKSNYMDATSFESTCTGGFSGSNGRGLGGCQAVNIITIVSKLSSLSTSLEFLGK